jgi:glycosyltransferase involved in cell wall biosynthesis
VAEVGDLHYVSFLPQVGAVTRVLACDVHERGTRLAVRVAIVVGATGTHNALASTAFVGALAEGLSAVGVEARVVGLVSGESAWVPDALGSGVTASAPLLTSPPPHLADMLAAAHSGVLDPAPDPKDCLRPSLDEWYAELVLQREFEEFASGDTDCTAMVYPRSYSLLRCTLRVARRLGWKTIAFSTEALSPGQIDATTREDYIGCVARECDGVWVVSRHLADFWRAEGVEPERLFVAPSMVRAGAFQATEAGVESSSAVYIGNLVHREIDYLLDITAIVRESVPAFSLTIYGDADALGRARLDHQVNRRGLGQAIRVEGPVLPSEVPRVLAAASVLLLPRASGEFSDEGFPNKLGEYLASGRPVVVSRVGDIPRYLVDGGSALLVPPDDCHSFAVAVIQVLTDRALAESLGARGREVARHLSKSDVVSGKVVSFIHGLPPRREEARASSVGWRILQLVRLQVPGFKWRVVRVLRMMGLKPPAPESERP